MKKLFLSVILALTLIVPSTTVFADQEIAVYVDGSKIEYPSEPVIQNGTTLVPLRQTFEALSADVDWNANTKTVTSTRDNTTVVLQIGNDTAYKNGTPIDLEVAPQIINGNTYVPLRFVAESFGADVQWNSADKVVYINSFYSNDYDPNYVETEYVLYSTGSLDTLLTNIALGNVVVIDGEYYATPEYATAIYHAFGPSTVRLNEDSYGSYSDDIDEYEWVSGGLGFDKLAISREVLEENGVDVSTLEEYIPNYYSVYGFFDGTEPIYLVPDMTDEFMNSQNATGTFSGIRMEMEDGQLWFYVPDLDALGIEW